MDNFHARAVRLDIILFFIRQLLHQWIVLKKQY